MILAPALVRLRLGVLVDAGEELLQHSAEKVAVGGVAAEVVELVGVLVKVVETGRAGWDGDGLVEVQPAQLPRVASGIAPHELVTAVKEHLVAAHLGIDRVPVRLVAVSRGLEDNVSDSMKSETIPVVPDERRGTIADF